MNGSPPFVLDTNVFIEAAKRYYAFDIVTVFWDELITQERGGRIRSIDRVKDELDHCRDALTQWANGKLTRILLQQMTKMS